MPRATMVSTVSFMLKHMDLLQVTNRVAGSLSGGNKRKLSAAIAFLGDPPVIFLGVFDALLRLLLFTFSLSL